MATYRKVPARIITVDYMGVTTAESDKYLKAAEKELSRLEHQVLRGTLDQGTRVTDLGDNVRVECNVCFNLKQATVIIGAESATKRVEEPCYCCSPCLAAGGILSVYTSQDDTSPDFDEYLEDTHYYADIILCQNPDNNIPNRITVHEERVSGGRKTMNSRVLQTKAVSGQIIYRAAFSDYTEHKPGDRVLVLIQPLYEFLPAPYGIYSPCVNRRYVTDEKIIEPQIITTTDFVNSSGMSCKITQDSDIWDEAAGPVPGDIKYQPFRILPIRIDSCL